MAPAFYALKDSRTPMMVSLLSIAINYFAVVALLTFTHLGHAGLALSTSVVAIINALILFWMLRSRIGGIHGGILFESVAKFADIAPPFMRCKFFDGFAFNMRNMRRDEFPQFCVNLIEPPRV